MRRSARTGICMKFLENSKGSVGNATIVDCDDDDDESSGDKGKTSPTPKLVAGSRKVDIFEQLRHQERLSQRGARQAVKHVLKAHVASGMRSRYVHTACEYLDFTVPTKKNVVPSHSPVPPFPMYEYSF